MRFFTSLGWIVRRAWPLLLLAWVLILFGTRHAAPPWNQVAQDREFAFLPADSPSRQAAALFARAFPNDRAASNIVLVLERTDPEQASLDHVLNFVSDVLEPGLHRIADAEGGLASTPVPSEEPLFSTAPAQPPEPVRRSIMWDIRTPNAPGAGALLVSPDQRALLVVVELTTGFLSHENWPTINRVSDLVNRLRQEEKVPPGVSVSMTGSAVIGRDHTVAELQSVHATEFLTILLVVVLLVVIYRAPLLALIPLITVYLSVQVAINVLAILAGAGHITLFQGIQIYITILAYGAGVDYCLFLTARYKEELDHGAHPRDAVATAVGGVGAALAASAATVICGIGMMIFAEFGKFREAGVAIALSLALVLCATLTFSPALLCLAGRWAFWPQRPGAPAAGSGRSWRWLFQTDALHWIWEHAGRALLRRPGTIWLTTVGVMAPFVIAAVLLRNHLSYDLIGDLPADSPGVVGTHVLERHFPAGVMGPVNVLLVDKEVDFSTPAGEDIVRRLTDRLHAEMPGLGLADVRSLTAPLGLATPAANQNLAHLDIPAEVRKEGAKRLALRHYTTDLGGRAKIGTRLDLILEHGPFAHEGVVDFPRLERAVRDALPAAVRDGSQFSFAGPTASVSDLAVVMQRDRTRIELLVLASVLAILILLLWRVLTPLYLLVSVLFSYYATLGVSFAVFWLLDPHGFTGIDWRVAIFLFTILIAVGEDYNIFLIARVGEEERHRGPVHGVVEALTRTGPIISSCGIIMAGTFGSLLGGTLTEMKQLGFALAFGVLLDTFVVRPLLVPAFLILFRGGRLPRPGWVQTGPLPRILERHDGQPEEDHAHRTGRAAS
jgi:RND superfamily putative drug exporter